MGGDVVGVVAGDAGRSEIVAARRRASAAWIMGEDTPRAALVGSLRLQRGLAAQTIAELMTGERFAPAPLTAEERTRLEARLTEFTTQAESERQEAQVSRLTLEERQNRLRQLQQEQKSPWCQDRLSSPRCTAR